MKSKKLMDLNPDFKAILKHLKKEEYIEEIKDGHSITEKGILEVEKQRAKNPEMFVLMMLSLNLGDRE